jgi:hypothetical protein
VDFDAQDIFGTWLTVAINQLHFLFPNILLVLMIARFVVGESVLNFKWRWDVAA